MADATVLKVTATTLASNAFSIVGAGTIDTVGAPTVFTLSGPIAGPGSLTKDGLGTLVLSENNSFSNAGIKAGTLQVDKNGSLGAGGLSMAGGTTLRAGISGLTLVNAISTAGVGTIDSGVGILTLTGGIIGAGSITKAGAGTLTLTGASSYTGATTVATGKLLVNGALGNTAVTVNSGATLGGTGSIVGPVTVFGTYAPGVSPGTLTVGSLTLAGSTVYELAEPNVIGGINNDLTIVTGALTLGGSLTVVDPGAPYGPGFGIGIYQLFQYGGTLSGSFASLTLPTPYAGVVQSIVPHQINLVVNAPGVLTQYWDGSDTGGAIPTPGGEGGSGTWNAASANWTTAVGTLNTNWQGGLAVFAGLSSGTVTVNGSQSFAGLQFGLTGYVVNGPGTLSTSTAAYIQTGMGIYATINADITGTGSITKQGLGTLLLTGNNSFVDAGVSAGTLAIGSATALGAGGLSLAAGTTLQAAANLSVATPISTAGAGTIDTQAYNLTLSGPILGPGSITKTGSGTLTLSGTQHLHQHRHFGGHARNHVGRGARQWRRVDGERHNAGRSGGGGDADAADFDCRGWHHRLRDRGVHSHRADRRTGVDHQAGQRRAVAVGQQQLLERGHRGGHA